MSNFNDGWTSSFTYSWLSLVRLPQDQTLGRITKWPKQPALIVNVKYRSIVMCQLLDNPPVSGFLFSIRPAEPSDGRTTEAGLEGIYCNSKMNLVLGRSPNYILVNVLSDDVCCCLDNTEALFLCVTITRFISIICKTRKGCVFNANYCLLVLISCSCNNNIITRNFKQSSYYGFVRWFVRCIILQYLSQCELTLIIIFFNKVAHILY